MATVTTSTRTVHGNLVHYDEAGADTGGPVVVLLHGIASRAQQWHGVMADLGETCHVIAPDLLGHGESAKPRGDYSLGAHACGVRDLLAGEHAVDGRDLPGAQGRVGQGAYSGFRK